MLPLQVAAFGEANPEFMMKAAATSGVRFDFYTDSPILALRWCSAKVTSTRTFAYFDVLVDGISPDGCRDVVISDCIIKADDDALVLKTSFSLGRFVHSEHIAISNCIISSNASAIKIGTETNGDFRNISVTGCVIKDVRRAGIAIESVDGANISGILVSNVTMYNVATPLYIRLGSRLRAPEGTPVGSLRDVMLSNIFADSPTLPYKTPYLYLPGQQFIGPECTPFEFASQI
jgi:hypothetical protein